jgi:DNA-binding transcriptional LysR family regulator
VFPNVEIRHLYSIVVLAEELSFTRAASLLHVTQPALSRLVTDFEEEYRFHLFTRDKRRGVELTDAGRVFVAEAKSALAHTERAIHLARATHEGADSVLTLGHSPYADPTWIAAMLSIRLPLFPRLRIQTTGQFFSTELVRGVIAGELNLALVTTPPNDAKITSVPFDRSPLYAVLPANHSAGHQDSVSLQDLANDEWILLGSRVHPLVHDAILGAAKCAGVSPRQARDVLDTLQAIHFVTEHLGVAILTKPTALAYRVEGVVSKPLSDEALWVDTCVVMRSDDDSRMVNELVRVFLRTQLPKQLQPRQMSLPLPA